MDGWLVGFRTVARQLWMFPIHHLLAQKMMLLPMGLR
jgi:hypothetical protein